MVTVCWKLVYKSISEAQYFVTHFQIELTHVLPCLVYYNSFLYIGVLRMGVHVVLADFITYILFLFCFNVCMSQYTLPTSLK